MNSHSFLPANTCMQINIGRISHYNTEKKYGFIKTANNESYFFHADKRSKVQMNQNGVKNIVYSFKTGIEVEFQLRPSSKHTEKWEAYNLVYKSDGHQAQLIQDAAENKTLRGTLVKKENKYFIKHLQAENFIPVLISPWETDIEQTYAQRVSQTVAFTLTKSKHFRKLQAVISNRQFSGQYINLIKIKDSGQPISAVITGKNHRGYFAAMLEEGFNAFALVPKELRQQNYPHYSIGDIVTAKIKNILHSKIISIAIEE